MAENKTQRTKESVPAFLESIEDADRRRDAKALAAVIAKVTGESPAMWGTGIVGYGDTTYEGSGGRRVDWFHVGLAPRKAALTLYLMGGLQKNAELLKKLGPHKVGGGCLYLTKFGQLDMGVLEQLIASSYTGNLGAPAEMAKARAEKRVESAAKKKLAKNAKPAKKAAKKAKPAKNAKPAKKSKPAKKAKPARKAAPKKK